MTRFTAFNRRHCLHVFQSPRKPKGDCDYSRAQYFTARYASSNPPKSRKAIVTKQFSTMLLSPLLFQSPQKPKGDCDTRSSFKRWQNTASSSNPPKSRKAIVTSLMALTASKIESSSNHPKSRKAIVTPSKTLTQQIIASSSNPPKSRKAIVTAIK